jgi:hypothetical protein
MTKPHYDNYYISLHNKPPHNSVLKTTNILISHTSVNCVGSLAWTRWSKMTSHTCLILKSDGGNKDSLATWVSSSRLAWAYSHSGNHKIPKSTKRGQTPTYNYFLSLHFLGLHEAGHVATFLNSWIPQQDKWYKKKFYIMVNAANQSSINICWMDEWVYEETEAKGIPLIKVRCLREEATWN